MNNNEFELIVDKSRFIGVYIKNFNNIQKINEIIDDLSKKHKKSKHICWAYSVIIDGIEYKKYNDDGEPRGTAGLPILSVIEKNKINNVLIVIVRYFGGKKLGSSKLLRCYRKTANEVIKNNL